MQRVAPKDKILRKYLEMWTFTLTIKEKNPSKEKSHSEGILTFKRGPKVTIVRSIRTRTA